MTTLVLSVLQGPPGSVQQTRHVSSGGFGIGRAPDNDWVLDDPHCIVSKRHCVFRQDETGWWVTDVSRNGSFLTHGPQPVRLSAKPHRLAAGERLRLGEWEFAVDLEEDEASFRAMARRGGGGVGPQPPDRPSRMSAPPDMPAGDWAGMARPPGTPLGEDATPTRLFLDRAAAPVRGSHGLAALLEGASLAPDDITAPGRETEVLRAAGAALRATISEIRRFRQVTLGDPHETAPGGTGAQARPLAEMRTERDALRWLLSGDRRYDVPPDTVVEAAFAEFRQHHDCLVRAARQSARTLFESLDPDEPERRMLPSWLDLVPGWRRARSAALARRRYGRVRANLDRVIDQALARAYLDLRREAEARWRPR